MAEKLNPKKVVDFKELLMSNTYEQEALVILLEKKGIITRAELLKDFDNLRRKKKP